MTRTRQRSWTRPRWDTRRRARALLRGAVLLGVALGVLKLLAALRGVPARPRPVPDARWRSGWPLPVAQMVGAARADAQVPRDLRTPEALRPCTR